MLIKLFEEDVKEIILKHLINLGYNFSEEDNCPIFTDIEQDGETCFCFFLDSDHLLKNVTIKAD